MIWIGKGIATVAVWTGATILGFMGIIIFIGPILGLAAGVYGTMLIWCPNKIKDFW